MSTIIAAVTTAATFDFSVSNENSRFPVSFSATGLAGLETVVLSVSADNGVTYQPVVEGGITLQLDASNNIKAIYVPAMYRITKSITAAAVPVALSTATRA